MCSLPTLVARLRRDQAGATAIEYALVAMIIAIALVTVITSLGTDISGLWNSISTSVIGASG